jgi:3',5'-cyclic AMP phosphodiesterase CpdA
MSLAALISAALIIVGLSITEVEMITVTDTGFALTFKTSAPARPAITYGTDPKALEFTGQAGRDAGKYHHLAAAGLSPGTWYYYRISNQNAVWPRPPLPPKSVTTLTPPTGKQLFSFAVMNDVHAMEDIAGLIVLPFDWLPPLTPGFTWRNPADNYWEFTLRAAVEGINKTGAELCVINGDLTSWFTKEEFEAVKSHLDMLRMPYYVTRGNHDRVEDYPEDYFLATFGLDSSWYSVDHKGFHFIFLNDNRLKDGWMAIPEE